MSDSSATSSLNEKRSAAVHQLVQLTQPDDSTIEAIPDVKDAFDEFVYEYPEYQHTWILDSLRRSDYSRLVRSDETYVDYMGGCIFPESLVKVHSDFLSRNIMGNTHSVSNRLVPFLLMIDVPDGILTEKQHTVLKRQLRLLPKRGKPC